MNRSQRLRSLIKKYPEFYREVWLACLEIPEGQTRTYKWIARKIGRPKSCRAVGSALAKNPFAPEVPCHRVIGAGFTLGGYGGFQVKREILTREKRGYNSSREITVGDGKLQVFPVEFVLRKLGKT